MFQPNEPDAAASTPPSTPQAQGEPRREKVRLLIFGSPDAVQLEISLMHVRGYAEPNDWSDPLPTERPGEIMRILTRTVLMT